MKTIKKTFALLLALVMALGLSVSAMATEVTTTYTITITNEASGHTYEAYQIFSGTLNESEGTNPTLTSIAWGSGVNSTDLLTALTTDETLKTDDAFDFTSDMTAAQVADKVATYAEDGDKLKEFAKVVAANLSSTVAGTSTQKDDKTGYTITGLQAGYYLVKDQDDSLSDEDDTYTRYILKLVDDVEVTPKSDKTESQKKVKDVNDSTDYTAEGATQESWQDSADYDIGDDVPFQLKATIADDYDSYEVYKLTFHDTESTGLTFNSNSVKVYVDGVEIASSNYTVSTNCSDGCTFEVQFTNLKIIDSVHAGSVITVEYTSQLNSNAVIGPDGNDNKMHVTYSNNPNDTQGGENGKTPDDTVTVFTYKLVVNKVDEDGTTALAGAGFTLYKYDADAATEDKWVAVGSELTGNDMTTFTWSGLDDGDYKLSETTTPSGYNTLTDQYFTITATHETESDDPELKTLEATGDTTKEYNIITLNAQTTDGKLTGVLTSTVVNKKGTSLPSTGGIGTTIFYVVGGVLAVGAAILLVVKRRMDSYQD